MVIQFLEELFPEAGITSCELKPWDHHQEKSALPCRQHFNSKQPGGPPASGILPQPTFLQRWEHRAATPPRASLFSRKKRVNIISPRLKNIYITWDQRSLMTCRENYSGRNTSFINHSTRYSVPQVYAQLNLEFICPWTKESGSQSRSLSRSWRNTSGKKKIWILLSRPRIHSQLQ